ncbi:MAG: hypothetical protein D3908_02970 [Candidatus Electrothrix sp. AUS4]|nr:hypothetical protein [Candidatus Electrothrix sp. AUS4]
MSDVYKVILESNLEKESPAPEVTPRLAALFHIDTIRIFTSYEKRLREFYEVPLTYATPRFILSGTVDFMVARQR